MAGAYGFDGVIRRPVMARGGSVSTRTSIPRNCGTLMIIPSTAFDGATWRIQSLTPISTDETEVWNDAQFVNDDGDVIDLRFPYIAQQSLVLPIAQIGGGIIRLQADTAQTADRIWVLFFAGFDN